jgi:hypothetical protein
MRLHVNNSNWRSRKEPGNLQQINPWVVPMYPRKRNLSTRHQLEPDVSMNLSNMHEFLHQGVESLRLFVPWKHSVVDHRQDTAARLGKLDYLGCPILEQR